MSKLAVLLYVFQYPQRIVGDFNWPRSVSAFRATCAFQYPQRIVGDFNNAGLALSMVKLTFQYPQRIVGDFNEELQANCKSIAKVSVSSTDRG